MANVTESLDLFTLKNTSILADGTEYQAAGSEFQQEADTTNPFSANGRDCWSKPIYKTLWYDNRSAAWIQIKLDHSPNAVIMLAPLSNGVKKLWADEKIGYHYFTVKPSGAGLAIGDLHLRGRRF